MRKTIYRDFKKIIDRYNLISRDDCIAVEVSTDRNSVALLDCLLAYRKEKNEEFTLKFFAVSKGNETASEVKELMNAYGITHVAEIPEDKINEIYEIIEESGCTKAALPHNYNDIVNCTFMTFMQRKEVAKIHPMRESSKAKNLQFIRPLCVIENKEIEEWIKNKELGYVEESTVFSKVAFIEEKIVMPDYSVNKQFHFNVYECV